MVSRSHPNLLRRLFELEVPEVFSGTVELKSVAREAGYRSKVAVAARQDGIDPVGCCVGLRGIRIQNIVSELNGEKIDVVMWDPDDAVFIANALSPAQILGVKLNNDEGVATVVVPDKQLSLAIGKEGQNARLAAKLTGWRIDIKSASVAEAETKPLAVTEEEAVVEEELPAEMPVLVSAEAPASEALVEEAAEPIPFIPPEVSVESEKPQLRFAEDILVRAPTKPGAKPRKKKKKGTREKEHAEGDVRPRKLRRELEITGEDEEY